MAILAASDTQWHGYNNSIDPTTGTGIDNVVDYSKVYIYNGTPVPPGTNNNKKWQYQKSRKVNIKIWQIDKFYYIIKEEK